MLERYARPPLLALAAITLLLFAASKIKQPAAAALVHRWVLSRRSALWYGRRICLCAVIWNDLMWLTMVRMGLEMTSCKKVEDPLPRLVLLKAMDQECFSDGHTEAFVVAVALLVWTLILTPAISLHFIRNAIKQRTHRLEPMLQSFGPLYAPLRDEVILRTVVQVIYRHTIIAISASPTARPYPRNGHAVSDAEIEPKIKNRCSELACAGAGGGDVGSEGGAQGRRAGGDGMG